MHTHDQSAADSYRVALAESAKIEARIDDEPGAFRVLTGDRPTGNLHIGHYFGSLLNRVRLQDRGVDTLVLVADYQVITDRDSAGPIKDRAISLVADYLSVGIDPSRSTIFSHSGVPELNQLMLPFLALVTDAELRRNPTVKAELLASGDRPMSGLLLTYPVHQAADILFCKANVVPVGRDQLPHLELTRVISRRFDERFGRANKKGPIFPVPYALLSEAPMILGTDGQKMSKSLGNTVELGMSEDETAAVIKRAVTDSERHITWEPDARPNVANLLILASLASGQDPESVANDIGDRGAGELKRVVTESLNEHLRPIRASRSLLVKDRGYLVEVLTTGNDRVREIAIRTLDETREAMGINYR